MSRRGRRALAVLVLGWSVALGAAVSLSHGVSAESRPLPTPPPVCKHKCGPEPSQPPTPIEQPTGAPTVPVSGEVQGITAPTSPPYDDTRATPGPVTGTLVRPQAVAAAPAPPAPAAIIAHTQGEPGLTILLIIAGALVVLMLGSVTVALALR